MLLIKVMWTSQSWMLSMSLFAWQDEVSSLCMRPHPIHCAEPQPFQGGHLSPVMWSKQPAVSAALPGFLTVYNSPFNQSLRCHRSWWSIPHRLSLVTVSALQISLVRQQMQQKQQLKISNLSQHHSTRWKKHIFTLKTASTSTESAGVTSGSPMVKSMSITVDHLASLSCEDSLCVRRVARSTTNNRNMLFMVFPMPPLRKLVARPVHRAGQSLARSGLHTTNVSAIPKYYQYLSISISINAISKQVPCLS